MSKFENLYPFLGMVIFLLESLNVSGQRLTIQPSTVSVGGDSSSALPTTMPAEVVMECSPDNIGNTIDAIFTMYLKRNSITFAQVVTSQSATLTTNAPADIRSKSPSVEGTINTNNPSSSRLRVTYLTSRMDCVDGDIYQCLVTYKPQNADTTDTTTSTTLNVNVLPRDLQIIASMVLDYTLNPIQNQSLINAGEQIEFSCTGYVGGSQTTVIEWYRKISPNTMFQRFYPTQAGDNIDDGNPSSYNCEYSRTSKLRFTMTTADDTRAAFRCEVGAPGAQYRAHSQEFHIVPAFNPTNGVTSTCAWKTIIALIMSVFIHVAIF